MTHDLPLPMPPASTTVTVPIAAIKAAVAAWYDMTVVQIDSQARTRQLVRPRYFAMYIARLLSGLKLSEIAVQFGGRDHTSVMHGILKAEGLLRRDPDANAAVRTIIDQLLQHDPGGAQAERVVVDVMDEIKAGLIAMSRREPAFTLRCLSALSQGREAMKKIELAIAVAALLLAPGTASAQESPEGPVVSFEVVCTQSEAMYEGLAALDQMVVAEGINESGGYTLIFASPAGDWTMVLLNAEQLACMVDWGDGWRMALPGDPS